MLSLLNIYSVTSSMQAAQPAAWTTKPTTSREAYPTYEFHSTSAFTPVVGTTSYTSDISSPAQNAPNRVRMNSPWDKPTEPEIGVIDTPVGEPFILLILAVLYLFYRRKRKKAKITE